MEKILSEKIFVSIIIPVYNAGKYLSACLDSLIHQQLHEIEIIVVDDGSTDDSGQIADQYAMKDPRIRVVHRRNGNPGATRNVGLALATGEYVGFIDGDDWIDPGMFSDLYRTAKTNDSDIVVTGVVVEFMRDKKKVHQQVDNACTICESGDMVSLFFQLKEACLFAYPVNKIYRREKVEKHTIRFPELLPYEDLIFNLQIFKTAEVISLIPGTPYHYIRRDELSAAGSYSPDYLEACKLSADTFYSFFCHFNYPQKKIESFLREKKISDYSGYVLGFYKKNSPLRRKDRITYLKNDLYENNLLLKDLAFSSPVGFHTWIFYFLLRYVSPSMMDSFYLLLFFLRRHCDPVYRQFRKVISK